MTSHKPSHLVPKLRFPEFRNGPEWKPKALGDIATFFKGKGLSKRTLSINGTTQCIHYGELFTSYPEVIRTVNSRTDLDENLFLSAKDDVLMPTSDVTPNGLAKACCLKLRDVIIGGDVMVIRTDQQKITGEFLARYIRRLEQRVLQLVTGSTVYHLYATALKMLDLCIPSQLEQQQIADCLGSLDNLIAAEGRKLEALRQHKQGLMQQLFPQPGETVPRLRFPGFREAKEWDVRLVGDVFKVTRGLVLAMPLVQESRSKEAPYPVYSSQTKNRGMAGYYSEHLYQDAITWTTDGANAGDVNYRSGKFYCTNVCGVLLNNDGYANLCTAELINSVSRQHVSFIGNPKLMNGVMAMIAIPFPPLAEQQRIAQCLSSLDNVITAQILKMDALKQHKQGLMQQLFPSLDTM